MGFENKGSMPFVTVSREPDRSGNYVADGTNDHLTIQAAIDDLPTVNARTGIVHLKRGTYNIGSDVTIGKRTYLIGESCEGVVLQAVANMANSVIIIDATNVIWTDWMIKNLRIDLDDGTQRTGRGIYSTHADEDSLFCRERIHNVRIYDVDDRGTTPAALDLADIRHYDFRNLRIRSDGTCIRIRDGGSYNGGEGLWENIILGGDSNTNWIGIDLEGAGGGSFRYGSNISQWNRIQCGGTATGYGAGSIGVKILDEVDIAFYNLHCEGQEHNVWLEGTSGDVCERIEFFHPQFVNGGTDANQECWHFENRVRQCSIWGGSSKHSGSGKWLNDNAATTWRTSRRNKFWGHGAYAASGALGSTIGNATQIMWPSFAAQGDVPYEYEEVVNHAAPGGPQWNGRMVLQLASNSSSLRFYGYTTTTGWDFVALA